MACYSLGNHAGSLYLAVEILFSKHEVILQQVFFYFTDFLQDMEMDVSYLQWRSYFPNTKLYFNKLYYFVEFLQDKDLDVTYMVACHFTFGYSWDAWVIFYGYFFWGLNFSWILFFGDFTRYSFRYVVLCLLQPLITETLCFLACALKISMEILFSRFPCFGV